MSCVISIRLNEEEKKLLEQVSSVYGSGLSSVLKQLAFEKLEDEYDLQIIRKYETEKNQEGYKTYSLEETWDILDV